MKMKLPTLKTYFLLTGNLKVKDFTLSIYRMVVIFKLKKRDGGFFCQVWHMIATYLVSKKQGMMFLLDDTEWMFKHSLGWADYFVSLDSIQKYINHHPIPYSFVHDMYLHEFTLNDFANAYREVWKFTPEINQRIFDTMQRLGLKENEYDSIMIRRGDKMYGESTYIPTKTYVDLLLQKGLKKKVFVQTDDYNAFLEVRQELQQYDVEVVTTCPEEKIGCFVFEYKPEMGSKVSDLNDKYLQNIATQPKKTAVCDYSPAEMKEHVEEMLVGLEVCKLGSYLATDFQSNVTRFLYVSHPHPENVISIDKRNETISWNSRMKCPAHGFIPL
jgi:hypothetical protein